MMYLVHCNINDASSDPSRPDRQVVEAAGVYSEWEDANEVRCRKQREQNRPWEIWAIEFHSDCTLSNVYW